MCIAPALKARIPEAWLFCLFLLNADAIWCEMAVFEQTHLIQCAIFNSTGTTIY